MGRAGWHSNILAKMKLLWVLIVAAVLVAADDDDDDAVEEATITPALDLPSTGAIDDGTSSTAGRSRSRRPNSRIFGGLGNLIGAGAAILGGVLGGGRPVRPPRPVSGFGGQNPGFGGQHHGHGGQNHGFGGHSQGFGGQNPGFGGVGVNPGFGGQNPGFGGQVTGGCRFWCRTPQGQVYCCENANQGQGGGFPFTKPGQCPPVRPSCPPTRNFFGPP